MLGADTFDGWGSEAAIATLAGVDVFDALDVMVGTDGLVLPFGVATAALTTVALVAAVWAGDFTAAEADFSFGAAFELTVGVVLLWDFAAAFEGASDRAGFSVILTRSLDEVLDCVAPEAAGACIKARSKAAELTMQSFGKRPDSAANMALS